MCWKVAILIFESAKSWCVYKTYNTKGDVKLVSFTLTVQLDIFRLVYVWTSKPQLFHHVLFCVLSVGGWVGTDATDARVFSSGTTQGNEPKKEFNETPSSAKINFQSHLWPTAV